MICVLMARSAVSLSKAGYTQLSRATDGEPILWRIAGVFTVQTTGKTSRLCSSKFGVVMSAKYLPADKPSHGATHHNIRREMLLPGDARRTYCGSQAVNYQFG